MEYITSKRHPRRKDEAGDLQPFALCGSNLGCHTCIKSRRKSDLKDFGVGITLYFKMIKFLIYLFLCLSILCFPVFVIYWSGNESEIQFTNKQALSALTLGNIGESETVCNSHFYSEVELEVPGVEVPGEVLPGVNVAGEKLLGEENELELFCSYGQLVDLEVFGLEKEGVSTCSKQEDEARLQVDEECRYEPLESQTEGMHAQIFKAFTTSCYRKESCTLRIAPANFTSQACQGKARLFNQDGSRRHFYAQASCVDWAIYLPYTDFQLDRDYLGLVVTVTDLVVLAVFLLATQVLHSYQKLDDREVDLQTLQPDDFTIAVTKLPDPRFYKNNDELKLLLWNHFEKLNQEVGDQYDKND